MKKKIFIVCASLAVSVAAAVGYDAYRNANAMDDLFNANVEALSRQELLPDGDVICFHNPYDSGAPGIYLVVRDCLTCELVTAEKTGSASTCMR